jgi:hypothetical protein
VGGEPDLVRVAVNEVLEQEFASERVGGDQQIGDRTVVVVDHAPLDCVVVVRVEDRVACPLLAAERRGCPGCIN